MKVHRVYYMLRVSDMERAVGFYRSAFGFAVRFESPDWSELSWGDATVALHSGGARGGPVGLGLEVDDIEKACQAVRRAGGRIMRQPHDRPGESIRLADAADTEGNQFMLSQPLE